MGRRLFRFWPLAGRPAGDRSSRGPGDRASPGPRAIPPVVPLAATLVVAAVIAALAVQVAFAQLTAVSPSLNQYGYPVYYQDSAGLMLEQCLDPQNPLCGLAGVVPNPAAPLAIPGNFPVESFYWLATSTMATNGGGQALLVLGLEAGFGNATTVVQGEQVVFSRVRVRVDNLTAGQTYTVTHPYGTKTYTNVPAGTRGINDTVDIGIALPPPPFTTALTGAIGPFLRWDAGAPAGYVGDAATSHQVTGGTNGNIFKIDGPNVGGAGVNTIQTNLFVVQGKIYVAPTATPTATLTATASPTATATTVPPTATSTATATAILPTATSTATALPPTATVTATATTAAGATDTPTATATTAAGPTDTPTATATIGGPTATPTVTATATATVPAGAVANDDFNLAELIAAFPYATIQDTSLATSAADDPNMGSGTGANWNSVWFRFVAPATGRVKASSAGSDYDTALAAFTGARGSLILVASNDDTSASLQSELLFSVQAGTTYYLEAARVGAPGGGQLHLSVEFDAALFNPPANDNFDSATALGAFPYTTTQNTSLATTAADDPDMGSNTGVNSNTVWYRLVAPSDGAVVANTTGSLYDTVLAAFVGTRGALGFVASSDDAAGTRQSQITFNVQAAVTYYLEVAQYGAPGGGQLQLAVSFTAAAPATPTPTAVAAAPANDDLGSATTIGAFPYSVVQDTSLATSAVDDPDMGSGMGANWNSVWFRFTAPTTGRIRANTFGSNYDTALAVYTGARGVLVLEAGDDDTSSSLQSEVNVAVRAGASYYVEAARVGTPGGGRLQFWAEFSATQLNPPANDDFDLAASFAVFPYEVVQNTTLATAALDDPSMGANTGVNSNTLWYRFVPPSDGVVRADTGGSNYDTVVAAFTGTRGRLALVASNDDSGSRQSDVSFAVLGGATYRLEVAQYGDPGGGQLRLRVRFTPAAPAATPVPGDGNGGGGPSGGPSEPQPTSGPSGPQPTGGPSEPLHTPEPRETARPDDRATPDGRGPTPAAGPTIGVTVVSTAVPTGIPPVSGDGLVAVLEATPGVGVVRIAGMEVQVNNTRGEALAVRVEPMASPPANASVPGDTTIVRTFGVDVYSLDSQANRAEKDSRTEVVLRAELTESEYAALPRDAAGNPDSSRLAFLRVKPDGGVEQIPTTWVPNSSPPPVGWAVATFVPRSTYLLAVLPAGQIGRAVPADDRYSGETGFRVNRDAFWDYFQKRGGLRTFGYPVSREFVFMGFEVQMFQRGILQRMPNGGIAGMNLLDEGLMPYTRVNFSTFPTPDQALVASAPSVVEPDYAEKAIAYVRANVPDEWEGMPVKFLQTFLSTVRYEDAFPEGGAAAELVPLLNLELWGLPTSKPAYDPNNRGFVYQRFQRGILHYDVATGATQGLLLADYLKGVITGESLPADLAEQARGSRFHRQYDRTRPAAVARPEDLRGTDLRDAFEKEVLAR